jgi:hypothetical protein
MSNVRTCAAVAGLLFMAGPSIAQTPPKVYLQPNYTEAGWHQPWVQSWIAGVRYGEVNFLDQYVDGDEFKAWFSPLESNVPCPLPVGDRLGYDTCALLDVNGDKYNDWAETWYHADPVYAIPEDGHPDGFRLPNDAVIVPFEPGTYTASTTPAGVRGEHDSERVGFCQVVSGIQPEGMNGNHNTDHDYEFDDVAFIGTPDPLYPQDPLRNVAKQIWGNDDNARFAHDIATMPDIDGDGRNEVVFSSNATEGGRGSINVYAFSNRYNTDPDDHTDRWVCIWRIVGTREYQSELGYQLQDTFDDFDGDLRPDIMAASVWWRDLQSEPYDRDPDSNACDPGVPRRQRGAGWIFLTPPLALFQAIQNPQTSQNWPALPGDSRVKAPLVMQESDANLVVHNPVQTTACGPSPVADLGSAGDIDGDGIPDIVVNAGYIYDYLHDGDIHTLEQRRGLYIYLSWDGYDDTAPVGQRTLVGASAKYDHLVNGAPAVSASFRQLLLVPNHADLVIHGNHAFDYGYNRPSILGADFDNASETTAGQPDIALMLVSTQHSWNPGKVLMLMNVRDRFGPGSAQWSQISAPQDPLNNNQASRPVPFDCDGVFNAATDYKIAPELLGGTLPSALAFYAGDDPAIAGINIAGNFDGQGKLDYELAVNVVHSVWTPSPASPENGYHPFGNEFGMFTRGDAVVLDFLPNHGGTRQLMLIQGENDIMDPRTSNMLNGEGVRSPNPDSPCVFDRRLGDQGVGVNQQGCIPEPAWDQDGDGRDDLIIRAPFFPAPVKQVPLCVAGSYPPHPFHADIPWEQGPGDQAPRAQPYYVDGGVDYLILSPPAQPIPNPLQPPALNQAAQTAHFTVVSTALVPAVHPYNQFAPAAVHFGAKCGDPFLCSAVSVTLHRDVPTAGKFTLEIDFPYACVAPHATAGCITIDTRWRDSLGRPLCLCYAATAIGPIDPEPDP